MDREKKNEKDNRKGFGWACIEDLAANSDRSKRGVSCSDF